MSSAITRIVIKSDHIFRGVPEPGQIVSVVGGRGLFVVMNVDRKNRIAQLMEKSGKHRLSDVPFASIRTFNRNLAYAIKRFLDDGDEAKSGEHR